MAIVSVPFQWPADNNQFDITSPDITGNIKGVIFFAYGWTEAASGTPDIGGGRSFGATDGTRQFSASCSWRSGSDSSYANKNHFTDYFAVVLTGQARIRRLAFDSWLTTPGAMGVRCTPSGNLGYQYRGVLLFLTDDGGYEFDDVYVDAISADNGGTINCGFQPDAGMTCDIDVIPNATPRNGQTCVGMWVDNGASIDMRCHDHHVWTQLDIAQSWHHVSTGCVSRDIDTWTRTATIGNITSTSYDILCPGGDTGARYYSIAWKGKAGTEMALEDIDVPTIGDPATVDPGFAADYAFMELAIGPASRNLQGTENTVSGFCSSGFFMDTAGNVDGMSASDLDGADFMTGGGLASDSLEVIDYTAPAASTRQVAGTHTLDGSGLTLSLTSNPDIVGLGHVLFFKAAAGGVTPISFDGNIADINGTVGQPITPVDVSGEFSGTETPFTFAESVAGTAWPAGLVISSAGVISGTPTGAGTTAGCQVRGTDTDTATADSNAFSFVIASAAAQIDADITGAFPFFDSAIDANVTTPAAEIDADITGAFPFFDSAIDATVTTLVDADITGAFPFFDSLINADVQTPTTEKDADITGAFPFFDSVIQAEATGLRDADITGAFPFFDSIIQVNVGEGIESDITGAFPFFTSLINASANESQILEIIDDIGKVNDPAVLRFLPPTPLLGPGTTVNLSVGLADSSEGIIVGVDYVITTNVTIPVWDFLYYASFVVNRKDPRVAFAGSEQIPKKDYRIYLEPTLGVDGLSINSASFVYQEPETFNFDAVTLQIHRIIDQQPPESS